MDKNITQLIKLESIFNISFTPKLFLKILNKIKQETAKG